MDEKLFAPLARELDLGGISYIENIRGGSPEWYFGKDYPAGDPYEAMEIWQDGKTPEGTTLKLVHWPDGEVFTPIEKRPGLVIGDPVAHGGAIYLLEIDFPAGRASARAFDCQSRTLSEVFSLPLEECEDCYNLMLHTWPLMLTLQGNGTVGGTEGPESACCAEEAEGASPCGAEEAEGAGTREAYRFRIIWPEELSFEIAPNESFGERAGDLLYFSAWFEDPDYREETVVRSAKTGEILGRFSGDVVRMPNGELWRVS